MLFLFTTTTAHRRFTLAFSTALTLALITSSCGSRTELLPGEEPCAILGDARPCENSCGVGEQRCEAGIWRRCEVAPTSRECTDACGSGIQTCEDDVWQACVVPSASRACEGACGTGTQSCEGGRWLDCDVASKTRACEGACGSGEQTCSKGRWGECEVLPVAVECESVCGKGERICERGSWRPCNAPQPKPPTLVSIVRDFRDSHPDFELPLSGDHLDLGLVLFDLGPDDKPVYSNKANSDTTSGAANFDQWYRDVPMINVSTEIDLTLAPSRDQPGFFGYSNDAFFPIDNQLYGNEGRGHNFHFTLEASTHFEYHGGEVFSFSGDDDMWVFINHRLAIDLGGIHRRLSKTVSLDEQSTVLALDRGKTYPLHFFFAERHTNESHFTINTSISEPGSCD